MKTSGIYKISNTANCKIYVGSSLNIKVRWGIHRSQLRNNCHPNAYLQRAWNKYGEENFSFEIIEECAEDILLLKEQEWLDSLKSFSTECGYNILQQAYSPSGYKHSEKSKEKISKGNKGKKRSEECKKKLSNFRLGKSYEDLYGSDAERLRQIKKEQIKINMINRKTTNETRAKISKANKGRIPWNKGLKHSEATKLKMRKPHTKK